MSFLVKIKLLFKQQLNYYEYRRIKAKAIYSQDIIDVIQTMISNNNALANNSVLKEIAVFNTAYTGGIQSFTINDLISMKIAYIYVKHPHAQYGAPVNSLSITGNICANSIQANLLNTDKNKNFSNGYGLVPFIPSSTSVTIKISCMRENTFAVLQ